MFLNEIKRRFKNSFGNAAETAIAYSMNTEFARVLSNEMKHYSESNDVDTISRVHGELDELKNIMVKNIGKEIWVNYYESYQLLLYIADNVAMRGERLELLVNKAESLNSGVSWYEIIRFNNFSIEWTLLIIFLKHIFYKS